jgi:transcriptional regulator with GAF, ATPase, and Fis domain
MLTLTEETSAEPRVYRFNKGTIRLGRVDGNDLVLAVSHISSRHAQIRFQDGQYVFSDLDSTNGSLVLREGKRILLGSSGEPEVALRHGDELILGDIDSPIRLMVAIESKPPLAHSNTIVASRDIANRTDLASRISSDKEAVQAIFRLVSAITVSTDRQDVLQYIADSSLDAIPEAVDALVVLNETKKGLTVGAESHRGEGVSRQPNTKICEQVLESREAILFGQASPELPAATLVGMGVGSGIAAPLFNNGQTVGLLQINCITGQNHLGELALDLAVVLAHHASNALQKAELIDKLRSAQAKLREENTFLKARSQPTTGIIAESAVMLKVIKELDRAAQSDVSVMLSGETGTGKEVFARYVHSASKRSDGLMVPVNCGALSETLLDSELFGHKKGAFTGANTDRKGVFEVASGGTVFLDEIGEMPLPLQVRLLRILEEGKIRRVGESVERPVDMRIIAATNRDLAEMVKEGSFREDLYYRLRVFPVRLPPLRERPADIEPLCRFFVEKYAQQMGRNITGIDDGFIQALQRYPFPGNVRELANEVERAVVRADDHEPLSPDLLSEEVLNQGSASVFKPSEGPRTLRDLLAEKEREIISECLARNDGRKTVSATELGLTRQGLAKKMDRLGLS